MLDRFKITLGEYARLTDRQIFDLYLHARTPDGSVDPAEALLPDAPPASSSAGAAASDNESYDHARARLDALADALHMGGDERLKLHEQLKQKYHRS